MLKVEADELYNFFLSLEGDRHPWDNEWDTIFQYVIPRRSPVISDPIPAENRNIEIYDNTPARANNRLAAGLNSMLTNKNILWFGQTVDDPSLEKDRNVKELLDQRTKVTKRAYDNSNFYNEVFECYADLGAIGNMCLYVEPYNQRGSFLNFKAIHVREIYIAEDPYGIVDTVFRRFKMTVKQCYQRWGKKVSENTLKKLESYKTMNDEVEILHCVFPRMNFNPKKADKYNMPIASVWMESQNKHVISEGGYTTMPYIYSRWSKSTGELYGRGIGNNSIADCQTLNEMNYTLLRSAQVAAEPPIMVPDDSFLNFNVEPRGVSYYRSGTNDRIETLDFRSNLPVTLDMIKLWRDNIESDWMKDNLELLDKREMTATETRARIANQTKMMGPYLGRQECEFLDRLNYRVTDILENTLLHSGEPYLEPLPEDLKDKVSIIYTSPIARQVRAIESEALGYWLQVLEALENRYPEARFIPNVDKIVRFEAEVLGVPQELINAEDVVEQSKQQAQQAAEEDKQFKRAMMQQELGKKQAETQKDTALANKHNKQAQGA